MIGDNYGQVGWPQCGEIDMVEVYGQPGWDADSTVHCAGNNGNDVSKEVIIPGGVDTGWHIYHLRWDGNTGVIQFSKDNQVYLTVGAGDIPGGNWVFGTPGKRGGAMFMILNILPARGPPPQAHSQVSDLCPVLALHRPGFP
jgi:beta-glucanase (GH16 family)